MKGASFRLLFLSSAEHLRLFRSVRTCQMPGSESASESALIAAARCKLKLNASGCSHGHPSKLMPVCVLTSVHKGLSEWWSHPRSTQQSPECSNGYVGPWPGPGAEAVAPLLDCAPLLPFAACQYQWFRAPTLPFLCPRCMPFRPRPHSVPAVVVKYIFRFSLLIIFRLLFFIFKCSGKPLTCFHSEHRRKGLKSFC